MDSLLLLAVLYLGTAVLVVPLSVRLGLGSVLGYLGAGMLMGPVLGLAGGETMDLQHVAELGVVMMLFLIGLELDPKSLWNMRHRLVGLGLAQLVLTTALATGILMLIGLPVQAALTLGMIAAPSSTAIVLQTLTEKGLLRSTGGQSAFAVLLAQDIAVIPFLALLPLLATSPELAASTFGMADAGHGDAVSELQNLIAALPGWAAALVTLAVVGGIVLVGAFLSRPVFRFVHASNLPEMGTFIALLLIAGIAFLMQLVGLSPALGTFVAGVVLANSEFRHQIHADVRPFKGLLLGLFFMTVGIGIDTGMIGAQASVVILCTLALIVGKAVVLWVLAVTSGLTGRDRWLFTLSLAQAGEFGFLLVAAAAIQSILPEPVAQTALLVLSLSMLATPALFLAFDWVARRLSVAMPDSSPDPIHEQGPVIIAGIGRFGQTVNRFVTSAGVETVVLDSDMAAIDTLRRYGFKGFFGDPTHPELLDAAGLAEASVLVVAVDDRESCLTIVRHARRVRPDLHIVARARDMWHLYELRRAGANEVVRELLHSSIRAGRCVLESTGYSEAEALRLSQAYYRHDVAALNDLETYWVPGQPAHLNKAFVARSQQLARDLEISLMSELDEDRSPRAAE